MIIIHTAGRWLPNFLLANALNEYFHLLRRVEQVVVALVKDPHLCWKDKSKVNAWTPELLFHLVILSPLFLYFHRQVWKKHDLVVSIHHFSFLTSCSHYSNFILIVLSSSYDESTQRSVLVLLSG